MAKPEGWRNIVGSYRNVLSGKMEFTLYPEELISHPPAVIQDAIIQGLKETGDRDPNMKNFLVVGYVALARFVSKEDFKIVRACESLLKQHMPKANPAHLTEEDKKRTKEAMSKISPEVWEKYAKIVKDCSDLAQAYTNELKSRLHE